MSGSDPAWSDIRPIRYYAKSSLAAGSDAGSEHDLIAFFGSQFLCIFLDWFDNKGWYSQYRSGAFGNEIRQAHNVEVTTTVLEISSGGQPNISQTRRPAHFLLCSYVYTSRNK